MCQISIAENCNESQKTWFISTTNGFFATYVDKASMHHHIYLSGFYIFCRFSMFKLMQLQNCFWNLNSVYLWHHNLQSPVCFANMHFTDDFHNWEIIREIKTLQSLLSEAAPHTRPCPWPSDYQHLHWILPVDNLNLGQFGFLLQIDKTLIREIHFDKLQHHHTYHVTIATNSFIT